jgi:nucleoside-diphosphate-sugar epimerase
MMVTITGANGYLGYETLRALSISSKVKKIVALVRNATRFKNDKSFLLDKVNIVDIDDLYSGIFNLDNTDVLCHLAASRDSSIPDEIASSLKFTNDLVMFCIKSSVKTIINASSQAVYGNTPTLWSENSMISPATIHGEAKWASELMFKNLRELNQTKRVISLRLSKIIGVSKNLRIVNEEPPHLFAYAVANNKTVSLKNNSRQLYDLLDIRDASMSIVSLIESTYDFPEVMNIGSGKQISLLEIAEVVSDVSKQYYGKPLNFYIDDNKQINFRNFGMNTELMNKYIDASDFKDIKKSVKDVLDYLYNNKKY